MKKRKRSSVFSILTSNRGESLTETLVAMLIISLSMAFLASSIAASTQIGKKAMEEDKKNLDQWNQAELAIGKIQNGDPTSDNINRKIMMIKSLFIRSKFFELKK